MPFNLDNITPFYIIVQAVGFGALGVSIISFQSKKRGMIIFLQLFSSILWSLQFVLLGNWTGAAINMVSIPRNIVYFLGEKHEWARGKAIPYIFIFLYVLLGILTYQGWLSVLPPIAMVIQSVAYFLDDPKTIRKLSLLVSPPWLIYGAFVGSIGSVLNEIFCMTSIIIAMIRYRKYDDNI